MVWVVSRFRLKASPGISSSCISPLTSSGQRSRASWASQPQKSATLSPQPGGKPRKFIRTCSGIGGRHNLINKEWKYFICWMLPKFQKRFLLGRFAGFFQFVHLVRATSRWRWAWSVGVEWHWQGRKEIRGVLTHPAHYVDHKPHTDWTGPNPGLHGRRITALAAARAKLNVKRNSTCVYSVRTAQ